MGARVTLEDGLFEQFGPKLTLVGVGPATEPPTAVGVVPADGAARLPTPALNAPIASALIDAGLAVSDPDLVADADLAGASASARFRDVLQVRVMELIDDRWPHADQVTGSESSKALGKLYELFQASLAARRAEVKARYGIGRPALARGSIRLDFLAR